MTITWYTMRQSLNITFVFHYEDQINLIMGG